MTRLGRWLRQPQFRFRISDALAFAGAWLWNEILLRQREYQLSTPWAEFRLTARRGTSDYLVFVQVFVLREYRALDELVNVKVVIDCGANVGYSAAYFLSRFPDCRVIAIEPDPDNYALLVRNLAAYGERATALCAAVWSHPGLLVPSESVYRDGREWARQVREAEGGEAGQIRAVDLPTLLELAGAERVALLKMDIEGAEAVVFASDATSWLERIDALAIELHDDSRFGPATPVFMSAIAASGFTTTRQGELTICRRPPRIP